MTSRRACARATPRLAAPLLASALVAAALLHGSAVAGEAQQESSPPGWVLNRYTTADGLPQNSVNDILRTRDGFLWVGTFGGLARFDGVSFTAYDLGSEPRLPGARILALAETPDRTLWIGTQENGLVAFRNGAFETVLSVAETGHVVDLAVDARGRLWIAAERTVGTLSEPEGLVPLDQVPEGRGFAAALEPEDETMWVAFAEGVVERRDLEGRVLSRTTLPRRLGSVLRDLHVAGPGEVWVPTELGLATAGAAAISLTRPGVRQLLRDEDGHHWVFDDSSMALTGFTTPRSASSPDALWRGNLGAEFRTVHPDEGSIWIGTTGGGLLHLRQSAFERWAADFPVDDVAAGPDDQVWAARCGGLYRLGGEDRPRLLGVREELLATRCLRRVGVDGEGRVWTQDRDYAFRYLDGVLDSVPLPTGERDHGPFIDSSGAVWMHVQNRFFRWDSGWTQVGELTLGAGEGISAYLAEGDGFWLGTARRLVHWTPSGLEVYDQDAGLSRGTVRALLRGPRGRLLAGHYGGGLSVLTPEGDVQTLTVEEGLSDNFVVGMALDDEGLLWISGNNGLAAVEWSELEDYLSGRSSRVNAAAFGRPDGFTEGNGVGVARTIDGRIWFSTIDGVVAVDPVAFRLSSAEVEVSITEVLVNGERVAPGDIGFPSSVQGLEVRYTAPVFSRPENVHFEYRLQGLDDEWMAVAGRRSAFFSRLPPGDYTFQVQGHSPGSGSVSRASLPIRVIPLWYQRTWVQVLALLAAAGLAVGLVRWRLRRAAERAAVAEAAAARLQREMDERSRLEQEREALSLQLLQSRKLEAVGRLTGGIAHDFNNLLTAMIGHLDLLSLEVGGEASDHVRALHESAQRAGSLTRGLLAFSRRSVLTPGAVDLQELLVRLEPLIKAGLPPGTFLRWEVPADLSPVMADQGGVETSILNLCINSRDAMPDGGQIRIGASEGYLVGPEASRRELEPGRYVLLTVADTGVGMSPEVLERVLEPFFTTKEVGKGTGLGLSTAFGFAKQSGGHLEITSKQGFGTEVTLILPVATEAALETRKQNVSGIKGRGRNVLLVEDDQAVQAITREYLKQMGFRTLDASTVAEARRILAQPHLLDVVLTDIMLPGETGFVLARELVEERPELPLILTSGGATLDDEALEREGLPNRVGLLPKPFSRDQLAEVLAVVLNRSVEAAGR